MPDGFYARRDLRTSYTVYVANHSAAPIMGLRVEIYPLEEREASRANPWGPSYFEHNVQVWLAEATHSKGGDFIVERLGPWVFPPRHVESMEVALHIDLEFCNAHVYFWDSQGAKWGKDIKTGELEPLIEPLGLVHGDTPVRRREASGEPEPAEAVSEAELVKAETNGSDASGGWRGWWLLFLLWYSIRQIRSKRR